jgi:hypothetical protein
MLLQEALATVKAAGYRVSIPRTKATKPTLNALGLPMSPQYDPNYRMKYKTPGMARFYAPQNFPWVQA